MPVADVRYDLRRLTDTTFDQLFPVYDWSAGDGYNNIGRWVKAAAQAVGR